MGHTFKNGDVISVIVGRRRWLDYFISNTGEDFAEFYFYDKNTAEIPDVVKNYMKMPDIHTPKLEAGDVIVFPSHLLHGVTMHRSDVRRRTLSTNFSIDIQTHSMHT